MAKLKTYISKPAKFLGFGIKKTTSKGTTQGQKFSPCEYSIKGYEHMIKIHKSHDGFWWTCFKGSMSGFNSPYTLLSQAKINAVNLITMHVANKKEAR